MKRGSGGILVSYLGGFLEYEQRLLIPPFSFSQLPSMKKYIFSCLVFVYMLEFQLLLLYIFIYFCFVDAMLLNTMLPKDA